VKGDGTDRKASVAEKDKPKPAAASTKLMTVEKAEAGSVRYHWPNQIFLSSGWLECSKCLRATVKLF
jgi:hypothetical protein